MSVKALMKKAFNIMEIHTLLGLSLKYGFKLALVSVTLSFLKVRLSS